MVHLARIPLRCGYNRDGRRVMLNLPVRVTEETRKLDQVEYYLNIVSSLEGLIKIPLDPPFSKGENRFTTFQKRENRYPPLEKGGEGGFENGFMDEP